MPKKTFWLRNEFDLNEKRTILTPIGSKKLIELGAEIIVEQSNLRVFSDNEYKNAGCVLTESNSWRQSAGHIFVLGLSPLSKDEFPIMQNHVYFADAFKNTPDGNKLLHRFQWGNGTLYDLFNITGHKFADLDLSSQNDMPPTLPKESSVRFSTILFPHLVNLVSNEELPRIWKTALMAFEQATENFKESQRSTWSEMSIDRREKIRVRFRTNVDLTIEDKVIQCKSQNISLTGIFLETKQEVELSKKCNVFIKLSSGSKDISFSLIGEVVRSTKDGLGFIFTDMNMNTFDQLKQIVKYNAINLAKYYE